MRSPNNYACYLRELARSPPPMATQECSLLNERRRVQDGSSANHHATSSNAPPNTILGSQPPVPSGDEFSDLESYTDTPRPSPILRLEKPWPESDASRQRPRLQRAYGFVYCAYSPGDHHPHREGDTQRRVIVEAPLDDGATDPCRQPPPLNPTQPIPDHDHDKTPLHRDTNPQHCSDPSRLCYETRPQTGPRVRHRSSSWPPLATPHAVPRVRRAVPPIPPPLAEAPDRTPLSQPVAHDHDYTAYAAPLHHQSHPPVPALSPSSARRPRPYSSVSSQQAPFPRTNPLHPDYTQILSCESLPHTAPSPVRRDHHQNLPSPAVPALPARPLPPLAAPVPAAPPSSSPSLAVATPLPPASNPSSNSTSTAPLPLLPTPRPPFVPRSDSDTDSGRLTNASDRSRRSRFMEHLDVDVEVDERLVYTTGNDGGASGNGNGDGDENENGNRDRSVEGEEDGEDGERSGGEVRGCGFLQAVCRLCGTWGKKK